MSLDALIKDYISKTLCLKVKEQKRRYEDLARNARSEVDVIKAKLALDLLARVESEVCGV